MEKGKKIMYEQNGNVTQDIENIKRKKKKNSVAKITITEMKNLLEGFKSRCEDTGESVNFKIGKSKEKRLKKSTEYKAPLEHLQEEQYTCCVNPRR